MSSAEQKLAQIAAIIGGEPVFLGGFVEGIGEPSGDAVPYVTLEFADQFRSLLNQDGQKIALPEYFTYARTAEVYNLSPEQLAQNQKNTGSNARMHNHIVYEYVPDAQGNLQMGTAYAGQDGAHPNVHGLVALNDTAMHSEILDLVANLVRERSGPVREDFDQ